jgi:hypothetical protein
MAYSSIVALAGESHVRATLEAIDPLLIQLRGQVGDDAELLDAIAVIRQRANQLRVPGAPGLMLKIGVPTKKGGSGSIA